MVWPAAGKRKGVAWGDWELVGDNREEVVHSEKAGALDLAEGGGGGFQRASGQDWGGRSGGGGCRWCREHWREARAARWRKRAFLRSILGNISIFGHSTPELVSPFSPTHSPRLGSQRPNVSSGCQALPQKACVGKADRFTIAPVYAMRSDTELCPTN